MSKLTLDNINKKKYFSIYGLLELGIQNIFRHKMSRKQCKFRNDRTDTLKK